LTNVAKIIMIQNKECSSFPRCLQTFYIHDSMHRMPVHVWTLKKYRYSARRHRGSAYRRSEISQTFRVRNIVVSTCLTYYTSAFNQSHWNRRL